MKFGATPATTKRKPIFWLVGGLVAMFYFPRNIGILIIIPIDELIFFRGVAQTTNQILFTGAEAHSPLLHSFCIGWNHICPLWCPWAERNLENTGTCSWLLGRWISGYFKWFISWFFVDLLVWYVCKIMVIIGFFDGSILVGGLEHVLFFHMIWVF